MNRADDPDTIAPFERETADGAERSFERRPEALATMELPRGSSRDRDPAPGADGPSVFKIWETDKFERGAGCGLNGQFDCRSRGPIVMQDIWLLEKMGHFDRRLFPSVACTQKVAELLERLLQLTI